MRRVVFAFSGIIAVFILLVANSLPFVPVQAQDSTNQPSGTFNIILPKAATKPADLIVPIWDYRALLG
jgi:hypothetical protein